MTAGGLHVQLWSYNFEPEPTGIGPISGRWAKEVRARGHEVDVVAAHPHYPAPAWGTRVLPYRERCEGVPVLRLPLAIGRQSTGQRLRQELSYAAALLAALPALGRPDVVVAVSPSFPALLPAIVNARARRLPLVLWLKDLLPDGAVATGLISPSGTIFRASRALELAAYRTARRIAVISRPFIEQLKTKGVEEDKLQLVRDPATRPISRRPPTRWRLERPLALCMGNIGHTQGLAPLVRAFEASTTMAARDVRLVLTGSGVAAPLVRREIASGRVEMPGVVDDETLENLLQDATLAVVSQSYEGTEFNLPSKVMNYMAYGIPIIAAVNPRSEVAHLVEASGSGWVADSSRPELFPAAIQAALSDPEEIERRGERALRYAEERFSIQHCVDRFEEIFAAVTVGRRWRSCSRGAPLLSAAPEERTHKVGLPGTRA